MSGHPIPQPVAIRCADGTALAGHFFAGTATATVPASSDPPAAPVLISPATGVRQQFYWRFAAWLAAQGHPVLVFDYRGIGLSRQGPLARSRATLADWGQQDQAAALDCLLQHTGAERLVLVGHSAGGQMIGLQPRHDRVARLVGVAASTGWLAAMRWPFRWRARLGLRVLLPLGARLLGYAPSAALGLGENLPAGVARQWGQWCAAGGYATNAVRGRPEADFHAQVRSPVTVLHALDDDIANPATVADLLRTLPAAPHQVLQVDPAQFGLAAIGHLDWFRSSHQGLWPLMGRAVRGEPLTA